MPNWSPTLRAVLYPECTVKILNIRTPQKIAVIILKLEQDHFTTE